MKRRIFPRTFIFLNLFSFLFLQAVHAQSGAAAENLYAVSGGDGAAAAARPRVYVSAEKARASFDKNAFNLPDIERRVFDSINKKRIEAGLPALEWNEDVARMARRHSENMAAQNFFSHAGLDGKMVNDRADDAGIKHWRMIGENIAYNRGYADASLCAVEKWMLSPGHRDNILRRDWTETGIGVALTAGGTFYFTQVFLLKK